MFSYVARVCVCAYGKGPSGRFIFYLIYERRFLYALALANARSVCVDGADSRTQATNSIHDI